MTDALDTGELEFSVLSDELYGVMVTANKTFSLNSS
jgi:hypothetical protein